MMPAVGGFFELALPDEACRGRGILSLWRVDPARDMFAGNARSALARLLRSRRARRVWLPAYSCEALLEAAATAGSGVDFFPLTEALAPDVEFLARKLKRGDYVLAVDYFGASPGRQFLKLVAERPEIGWIEDRAQALDPGSASWGDWILYSPRKLLGVPDGGILAARDRKETWRPVIDRGEGWLKMLAAQSLRAGDSIAARDAEWFRMYRESEAAQGANAGRMSRISEWILADTAAESLVRRRLRNYRVLSASLGDVSFLTRHPGRAPFGFPIRVRDAARLQESLVRAGVYAQRHWERLPSPPRSFPEAHRLARQLVTLPCDQRYGATHMRDVVQAVRTCLR